MPVSAVARTRAERVEEARVDVPEDTRPCGEREQDGTGVSAAPFRAGEQRARASPKLPGYCVTQCPASDAPSVTRPDKPLRAACLAVAA